jgi:HEAT repeat protein
MDDLTTALEALSTYDAGSGRALLTPIDNAVNHASNDASKGSALEMQLLKAFSSCRSVPAKEYVCAKLAIVGSKAAVPMLGSLLQDPQLCTAARSALEAFGPKESAPELRRCLRSLTGLQRCGVIDSLGAMRDPNSVGALAKLVEDEEQAIAASALAALGKIGTVPAADALRKVKAAKPGRRLAGLSDAILTCAEHLSAEQATSRARELYSLLTNPDEPDHVRLAAEQGVRHCSPG